MKYLVLSSLFFSTGLMAQSMNYTEFKGLAESNRAAWDSVRPGMSKITTIKGSVETESGACQFSKTSHQSVLKIEGENLIILSQDKFVPEASPACQTAGYVSFEDKLLFYQLKPEVTADLAYLEDASATVSSINREGNFVSLQAKFTGNYEDGTAYTYNMSVKYDLTLSGFLNSVSVVAEGETTTTVVAPDINLSQVDLTNVLFCSDNDGDNSECSEGNYSDILF